MLLADFILGNLEPILQEWENFARTVETPASDLDAKGLRDNAQQILCTVALDMRTSQTEQQINKSQGLSPVSENQTAAQNHGVLRLREGFTLDQMVSEYRALRSTVLRLWLAQELSGEEHQIGDMIRFNEAIDQAMVESIASYGRAVETTRKIVLGVLAHDLRSPLGAIMMSGDILRQSKTSDPRQSHLASQISVSVRRANQIMNDLLDLARFNLGTGIPVNKQSVELKSICQGVIEEVTACYPHMQIIFSCADAVPGRFDPLRIGQAFTNLISNAAKHGDKQKPVQVTLNGDASNAYFTVQNFGKPIAPGALPTLFNPQGRYSRFTDSEQDPSAGMGLGLFIAAEIVAGHGGNIEVESTMERGTIFTVKMPACRSEPARDGRQR
ncbi:HAMP domain-containing histidine kinase [Pseudomonas sp. PCH199]|uniref:sensor histidine kinase n=1 Tax=unclassified Pseudomonas TaxID=196821 RepID=UPI000BCD030D|nr:MULTISPECIES: HAMP domain-containing sensor histidine kinase [unclassified Pseudomonas]MCW8278437.1 HAMP domain-containing histidine kinase [Pseudomonas sp. PCH199]PAM81367.1 two-component sensor histidine kinase [Pseudomonas sp. ERMR1:02]